MDTQETQIKKSSSGRESHGVYVCHKCGWPFAKAHPSSKHRRAHKKLCGNIEGYKLFESGDHLAASDGEDQQTPMVDKRGSGSIGLQSNMSADDLFSDAVAEFSDSAVSPAIEDHIKDLNKDTKKLVDTGSVEGRSFGLEATAGTSDNLTAPILSIETSNLEVDEHVINQLENASSSSQTRIEESPLVDSIGVTALQFDTSPVIFGTPTDVPIEEIDADVRNEDINKSLTNCFNPHVEATRESPEPYLNEIDTHASYNLREESLTPVCDIEEQSKLEAKENIFLDFVTQHYLVESDVFPLQKHLKTGNSVTEFDGYKSGDQSEVQHIFEQSGEGKYMHVNPFKTKEEETTVSTLEKQKEADIAVYSLSVPDSLAGIANAAHLIEDFKDYASSELSLPLDLGSAEVIKYVGDDKQDSITGKSIPGFFPVHFSGIINSSTTDHNTLKDHLNEKEVEKPITDKSCVSESAAESVEDQESCSSNAQPEAPWAVAESVGIYDLSVWGHDWLQKPGSQNAPTNESSIMSPVLLENMEEATNHVSSVDRDQNKGSKFEEIDEDIEQRSKRPLENQVAANDKRRQSTDSLFLSENNQLPSSLKLHQSQVVKEAAVGISELSETIEKCGGVVEKNREGHEFAEPTLKSSDVDVKQSDFDPRGNMEQIASSSCKGAYKLSEIGTENVTDNSGSLASAVDNGEINNNGWILLSSDNQGTFITNEYPGCGSEFLQGKGDDKLETRSDGVSVSIASSSQADSIDGNWVSVSAVSSQSDTAGGVDARGQYEKSQTALQIHKGAAENRSIKSGDFESSSFTTLVEPGNGVPQTTADISVLSTQQQKDEDQKAGAFPSISDVVNESQGRKRNEIIAKESNWSTERNHSPLKSLLGEAKSPNSKQPSITQKDEISPKSSGSAVTTVDSILRSEPNDKEIEKEWDFPARYPVEIKKEKRRRKPYWVPFVCCSSVQRDL